MKYTTVIFDLDGTLLDTLQDLAEATNYALEAHKLPLRTVAEVRSFVGNGIGKLIDRAVPAGTTQELRDAVFATFHGFYAQHCADNTHPYPGLLELIAKLRATGHKTAIVSNKADYAVQALAEQYFKGLMDTSCGEREGIARKPAPDMLLAVMEKLGSCKEETVYVGDSDVDLATAANTGVDCISVEWGFRDKPFLIEHGAKVFAKSAEDILKILEM